MHSAQLLNFAVLLLLPWRGESSARQIQQVDTLGEAAHKKKKKHNKNKKDLHFNSHNNTHL